MLYKNASERSAEFSRLLSECKETMKVTFVYIIQKGRRPLMGEEVAKEKSIRAMRSAIADRRKTVTVWC